MKKGIDLTQSYDKAPTPTDKSKKQSDNLKHAIKNSITQQLRIDSGEQNQSKSRISSNQKKVTSCVTNAAVEKSTLIGR